MPKKIQSISILHHYSHSYKLDNIIGDFSNLAGLYLGANKLPKEIGNLTNLKELDLRSNRLLA